MTADPTAFELPPFYCPIEPEIHPAADHIEKRAIEWIDTIGLCETDTERGWVIGTRSAEFYSQ